MHYQKCLKTNMFHRFTCLFSICADGNLLKINIYHSTKSVICLSSMESMSDLFIRSQKFKEVVFLMFKIYVHSFKLQIFLGNIICFVISIFFTVFSRNSYKNEILKSVFFLTFKKPSHTLSMFQLETTSLFFRCFS